MREVMSYRTGTCCLRYFLTNQRAADNGPVTMYVTGNLSAVALLYATDVYGINATQNRL